MLWRRPGDDRRAVRLAYCQNLHAAEDVAGVLAGLRSITLPLRGRVHPGGRFGVGLYLAAGAARELAADADALARLRDELRGADLDPFTYNAFPYGGFHEGELKERVFLPGWHEPARLAYTLAVARAAGELARDGAFVSISTHTGWYGGDATAPADPSREEASASALVRCAVELERMEREGGPRLVLGLEAEPGANAGSTAELAAWRAALIRRADDEGASSAVARHLGACLDACHSAVELEDPARALEDATAGGAPLAKLQHTSALALPSPGDDGPGRELLLALDEKRYLHQVRGRGADGRRLAARDLGELRAALDREPEPWLAAEEWRCHFHVPVDRTELSAGDARLGTTREHAEELLRAALARPERWGADELHVEIETYTWDVLPDSARDARGLVDGLEREYARVFEVLRDAGWSPA